MPVLFLITFVNLLGFGLIIPLLPFYVERVGGSPEIITLIIALYSLLQFITAPVLGRLSDKYGRRIILIWTMAGTVLAYVLLGIAESLWLVIVARTLGGVMGGNLSVTYAYVSDISSPQDRPKSMGLIGAAFSLGFMLGPALGGLLAGSDMATANFFLPAMIAAGLSTIALMGVLIILPESLKPEIRAQNSDRPHVDMSTQLQIVFSKRTLAILIAIAFLVFAAWTVVQSIFALWANRVLDFGPTQIGLIFAYSGMVGVACQVILIGPLAKLVSEKTIVLLTIIAMCLGLITLSGATNLSYTLLSMTLLSASHSVFFPVISSLVSKEATETDRGVVLGVFQGVSSLGRVAGPTFAGAAFAQLGYNVPYLIGAAIMLPCFVLIFLLMRRTDSA